MTTLPAVGEDVNGNRERAPISKIWPCDKRSRRVQKVSSVLGLDRTLKKSHRSVSSFAVDGSRNLCVLRRAMKKEEGLVSRVVLERARKCKTLEASKAFVKKTYSSCVVKCVSEEDKYTWIETFTKHFDRMCMVHKSNALCLPSGLPMFGGRSVDEGRRAVREHDEALTIFLKRQGESDFRRIDAHSRRILLQLLHVLHDRIRVEIMIPEQRRQTESFERLRRSSYLLSPNGTSASELYALSGGPYTRLSAQMQLESKTRPKTAGDVPSKQRKSSSLFSESSKFSSEDCATTVNLSDRPKATTTHLIDLLRSRAAVKTTRYVRFSRNQLNPKSGAAILREIPTHVTVADFSRNELGQTSWSSSSSSSLSSSSSSVPLVQAPFAFARAIISVVHLRELNLSCNNLGTPSGRYCAELLGALRHNRSLTRLDLSSNRLGQDACALIGSRLLARNETLRSLDLSWNRIYDASPLVLHRNRALAELDLSFNTIGSSISVDSFVASLKRNRSLVHLNLSHNRMDTIAIASLSTALRSNRRVVGLHLEGTGSHRGNLDSLGHVRYSPAGDVEGKTSEAHEESHTICPPTTCWICAQWTEEIFSWIPPTPHNSLLGLRDNSVDLTTRHMLARFLPWSTLPMDVVVRVHFARDAWAPIPMRRVQIPFGGSVDVDGSVDRCNARFELRRLLPPNKEIKYLFSVIVPIQYAHQMMRYEDMIREANGEVNISLSFRKRRCRQTSSYFVIVYFCDSQYIASRDIVASLGGGTRDRLLPRDRSTTVSAPLKRCHIRMLGTSNECLPINKNGELEITSGALPRTYHIDILTKADGSEIRRSLFAKHLESLETRDDLRIATTLASLNDQKTCRLIGMYASFCRAWNTCVTADSHFVHVPLCGGQISLNNSIFAPVKRSMCRFFRILVALHAHCCVQPANASPQQSSFDEALESHVEQIREYQRRESRPHREATSKSEEVRRRRHFEALRTVVLPSLAAAADDSLKLFARPSQLLGLLSEWPGSNLRNTIDDENIDSADRVASAPYFCRSFWSHANLTELVGSILLARGQSANSSSERGLSVAEFMSFLLRTASNWASYCEVGPTHRGTASRSPRQSDKKRRYFEFLRLRAAQKCDDEGESGEIFAIASRVAAQISATAAASAHGRVMSMWIDLQHQSWMCAIQTPFERAATLRGVAHNASEFRIFCDHDPALRSSIARYVHWLEVIFEHYASIDSCLADRGEISSVGTVGWSAFCEDTHMIVRGGNEDARENLDSRHVALCFLWSLNGTVDDTRRLTFRGFLEAITRVASASLCAKRKLAPESRANDNGASEPFLCDGFHVRELPNALVLHLKRAIRAFRARNREDVSKLRATANKAAKNGGQRSRRGERK
eukprot:g2726.t1